MNESVPPPPTSTRFLTLEQVAEELATTKAQVYALVRRGDLRSIKLGGRGQWRVGRADLEDYLDRVYSQTEEFIVSHPYVDAAPPDSE